MPSSHGAWVFWWGPTYLVVSKSFDRPQPYEEFIVMFGNQPPQEAITDQPDIPQFGLSEAEVGPCCTHSWWCAQQGGGHMSEAPSPVQVFISYAHDDPEHIDRVRDFWLFLRSCGIDAQLDLPANERRQDWSLWMLRGIRDSRYALVVASPQYKRRAEGDAAAGEGMGVQWEAGLLRRLVYEDPDAARDRIVPVVLPGGSAGDLPVWLGGATNSYEAVEEFTVPGAESLLRLLTGQPYETVPEPGPVPVLAPRDQAAVREPLTLPAPVVAPAPVLPPQPPPATFVFPDPKVLLERLMGCEKLHQLAVRHELVLQMGDNLGLGHPFSVPESAETRSHLRALVRSVSRTLARDATLKALLFALEEIVPDDIGTAGVRALLVESGLELGLGLGEE
ncbi:TIR domain-containing protein [Streptomyces plumbiresistens]|uniref:SEFIR domain-containing protein n=1 Tax=Streptomyces plumbiresistens TaxID=511811 RepID=A0ABP7Q9I3_9ACTN